MSDNARLFLGDCLEVMRDLPEGAIQYCVTSPPYFGLRDYGHIQQIGTEATMQEYIGRLVSVFDEVHRLLSDDGTLWLNLGDSYAHGKPKKPDQGDISCGDLYFNQEQSRLRAPCLKPKDLCGIPWRVAFALQEAGWYLRSDIIWAKPNPMPESVTDRPTKSHEYVFLLAKSEQYFYNADAIKEPRTSNTNTCGRNSHANVDRMPRENLKQDGTHADFNERWSGRETTERNRRTVWTIPPAQYKDAHFATYPPELIRPMIRAGCPVGGTVLDPFAGSGTTGLVAIQEGRKFIGIELNPLYAEMAQRRIDNAQPSLFGGNE